MNKNGKMSIKEEDEWDRRSNFYAILMAIGMVPITLSFLLKYYGMGATRLEMAKAYSWGSMFGWITVIMFCWLFGPAWQKKRR
jgi:hypothetical protein